MSGIGILIRLTMFSVTSASLSVIWNREPLEKFRPISGLRQGDPSSPYLFVLVMEVLGQFIWKAATEKQWKGIKMPRGSPSLTHLFFADDLILLGEATIIQARTMEKIISTFCLESGQKVSTEKSNPFVSRNVQGNLARRLSQKFNIPFTSNLGKYLGVHSSINELEQRTLVMLLRK